LIVDYLMHVLLRYYETPGTTRRFKIVDTIGTMGMSVLAGGCSTFLGTLALAFSSTAIFWIIFITFTSIVLVGITHGLILLPVLLDTFGPINYVPPTKTKKSSTNNINNNNELVVSSPMINTSTIVVLTNNDSDQGERNRSVE
jgi:uncharacterized membrane protein YdfJ with MMPL/SSD domain